MHHTHFNSVPSTQIYLKENLEEFRSHDEEILISTSNQTAGVGRQKHAWDFYGHSLAMSFTLKPHNTPSLTPIEIGLLCILFFQKQYKVRLEMKWPNDLMTTEGKKCGGILCQYIDDQIVIAGLGMNIGRPENFTEKPDSYKHGLGFIDDAVVLEKNSKVLSFEIYQFILQNRMDTAVEVVKEFDKYCSHINKRVLIDDDQSFVECIFKGIGYQGEAVTEYENSFKSFFSSSLTVLE